MGRLEPDAEEATAAAAKLFGAAIPRDSVELRDVPAAALATAPPEVAPSLDAVEMTEVAPVKADAAVPACHMGRGELERLLRASDFGENEAMYRASFRPGMPVRCVVCGETVRAHGEEQSDAGGGQKAYSM